MRMDFSVCRKIESQFKRLYFFNLIINQFATIPYLISAILLLSSNTNGIYWIAIGFILCLIKSIMDSWVL